MRSYPFSAVVGMDDMALSLTLCAVSPEIGGVLVRGEKGTAKSTIVRALAALLPPVDVLVGCRFSCDPAGPDPECPDLTRHTPSQVHTRAARLVELPVGATEDRMVGALDLERVLAEGVTAFEPGLLAAAHRGLLYVDEVNLLHDHLVDALLDAAAMGRVTVEREGISVAHAASFLLVGTMNPEEGELRPQLLDRFGLTVSVAASRDPAVRAEVVRRRLAYEADPESFHATYVDADTQLAGRIAAARTLLPSVRLSDAALTRIAQVCAAFEVDGMRADLVTARTARAHAAWCGRTEVNADDIRTAAALALPHRRRRNPFDPPGLEQEKLDQALAAAGITNPDSEPDGDPDPDPSPSDGPPGLADGPPPKAESDTGTAQASREAAPVEAGAPFRARLLTVPGSGLGTAGRRSPALTPDGRTVRAVAPDRAWRGRPHLVGTIYAAAPHQHRRGRSGPGLVLRPTDVRAPVRHGKEGNLIAFCVDASGSMAARQRMREVKTAVLSLLLDAYQRRDKVGLVTFRGHGAELALPPTSSVDIAATRLSALATGGRTPLAEGLHRVGDLLRVEAVRDPRRRPLVVVVTDGRATAGADAVPRAMWAARILGRMARTVVIDCESGRLRLGVAAELAAEMGAEYLALGDVAAEALTAAVRTRTMPDRRPEHWRSA